MPAKRHLNGVLLAGRWWPAYSGIWILSSLIKKSFTPSDKTFWIWACPNRPHIPAWVPLPNLLCLLVPSADNLCKQFGLKWGPTKSALFDTLKKCSEKLIFKKKSADDKVCTEKINFSNCSNKGAQWLSGRVFNTRPRGPRFEPHWCHYVVSLSKTH